MIGRRSGILLAVATMAAGTVWAQQPPARRSKRPNIQDGVVGGGNAREASTAELRRALAEESAIVLDARPYDEYAISHIPGAQSVRGKPATTPAFYVADVDQIMESLPDRDQPMILYCNGWLPRHQPLPTRRPRLARAGRRDAGGEAGAAAPAGTRPGHRS